MGMSEGTSTFLMYFGLFWLIWAFLLIACCFRSYFLRRLKRYRDERMRQLESVSCPAQRTAPGHAPVFSATPVQIPHPLPQANWVTVPTDADVFGEPPCYEEAVQMEDPPPPYNEVLADPRGGTYLKPGVLRPAPYSVSLPCTISTPYPASCTISTPCPAPCTISTPCPAPCTVSTPCPAPCPVSTPCHAPAPLCVPNYPSYCDSKPPAVLSERGYSSLIRLPSSQRWDSLGHLLSNMDLTHSHLTPPSSVRSLRTATATVPRRDPRTPHELRLQAGYSSLQARSHQGAHGGLHRVRGLEQNCGLPAALTLLGRSTAV